MNLWSQFKEFVDQNRDILLGMLYGCLSSSLWSILFRRSITAPQMIPFTNSNPTLLPIIDLSEKTATSSFKIRKACLDSGFFYVTNHGIPKSLRNAVLENSRQYFNSSIDEKMKSLYHKKHWRGFEPLTRDRVTKEKFEEMAPDQRRTKESFYIGREISPESPESQDNSQGLNIWPDAGQFPDFRDIMTRYFVECWHLSLKIAQLVALSLGLSEDHFESIGAFHHPMLQLRLLHYDPTPSDPKKEVYAAKPHTDYGFVTLLLNDGVPGLQLYRNGLWVDIDYLEDAYVVNIGDMLQKFTAGMYKSSRHRVINVTGKDRYSVPFFFEPNANFVVRPLQAAIEYQLERNITIDAKDLEEIRSAQRLEMETQAREKETQEILKGK